MPSSSDGSTHFAPAPTEVQYAAAILSKGGLEDEVGSWIGTGSNTPVTAEQITAAVGEEALAEAAKQAGVKPLEAAVQVAEELPAVIDQATPSGKITEVSATARSAASRGLVGGVSDTVMSIWKSVFGHTHAATPEMYGYLDSAYQQYGGPKPYQGTKPY
ncbi:YidB family protein [Streptomyces sp. NPDC048045]|uniref:YidB family protein n=1 Tax=Streptomyces sp. NPDC048045 TaxID=3154710 RepID=UPI0034380EEE